MIEPWPYNVDVFYRPSIELFTSKLNLSFYKVRIDNIAYYLQMPSNMVYIDRNESDDFSVFYWEENLIFLQPHRYIMAIAYCGHLANWCKLDEHYLYQGGGGIILLSNSFQLRQWGIQYGIMGKAKLVESSLFYKDDLFGENVEVKISNMGIVPWIDFVKTYSLP